MSNLIELNNGASEKAIDPTDISCAVAFCNNRKIEKPALTFFPFPSNEKLAQIWATNAGLGNIDIKSLEKNVLCADHFDEEYFENSEKRTFKCNSEPVPTIFDKNQINKRKITERYCRLCATLQPIRKLIPLFTNSGSVVYEEVLKILLPGKIKINDKLPHEICALCFNDLHLCSKVLKKVVNADIRLRHMCQIVENDTYTSDSVLEELVEDPVSVVNENETSKEKVQFKFQCTICFVVFNDKTEILDHVAKLHPKVNQKIVSKIVPIKAYNGKLHEDANKSFREANTKKQKEKLELKFKCFICAAIFYSKNEMTSHALSAHPNVTKDKIVCKIINSNEIASNNKKELKTVHEDNRQFAHKFQCIFCSVILNSKQEIIDHVSIEHPAQKDNKIISRIIKVKVNEEKAELSISQNDDENALITEKESNMANVENNEDKIIKKFECMVCKKLLNSYEQVIKHSLDMHPNINAIRSREVTFKSNHTLMNNELTKLQCTICSCLCDTFKLFARHSMLAHPKSDPKQIVRKVTLNRISDNGKEVSPSKKLKILYDSSNTLEASNKVEEDNQEMTNTKTTNMYVVKYKCSLCSELFSSNNQMTHHASSVHLEANYNNISSIVIEVDNKKQNKEIVTSNKNIDFQYQCTSCFKLFDNNQELVDHTLETHPHIVERKYAISRIVNVCKTESFDEFKSLLGVDESIIEINPENKTVNEAQAKKIIEKRYKCGKCSLLFVSQETLIKHSLAIHLESGVNKVVCKVVQEKNANALPKRNGLMKKQKRRMMYECLLCCVHLKTQEELIRHTRSFHPHLAYGKILCRVLKKTHWARYQITSCLRCGEIFTGLQKYREHTAKYISYKCSLCELTFKHLSDMREHRGKHNIPSRMYNCLICGEHLTNEGTMLSHVRFHKPQIKVLYCIECNEQFYSRKKLEVHENIHKIPAENVSCDKCNEVFTSAFDLRKHLQVHDTALCNICGQLLISTHNLKKHMSKHTNERPYQCDKCAKTYKTMTCLKKHKQCHTTEKNFICQHCGKRFRLKATLNKHLILHGTDTNYACDICGRKFKRKDYMKKHREIHQKGYMRTRTPQQYYCNICKAKFPTTIQLNVHYQCHLEEGHIQCTQCNKLFLTNSNLKRHLVVHEKVVHQCKYCGKKIRRLKSLETHEMRHLTGQFTSFPCPICKMVFIQRKKMIAHWRMHLNSDTLSEVNKDTDNGNKENEISDVVNNYNNSELIVYDDETTMHNDIVIDDSSEVNLATDNILRAYLIQKKD